MGSTDAGDATVRGGREAERGGCGTASAIAPRTVSRRALYRDPPRTVSRSRRALYRARAAH